MGVLEELAGEVAVGRGFRANVHWGGRLKVSSAQVRVFLRRRGYELSPAWFNAFIKVFMNAMGRRGYVAPRIRG